MKTSRVFLITALLAAAACQASEKHPVEVDAGIDAGVCMLGKPAPPPLDPTQSTTSLSDDVTTYLRAHCQRMMQCQDAGPAIASEQSCIDGLSVLTLGCAPGLSNVKLPGLLACVAAWSTYDCYSAHELAGNIPQECAAAASTLGHVQGRSNPGEQCTLETYCDGHSSCDDSASPGCGVCVANANEGESCAARECSTGLNCNEQKRCEKPAGSGTPCDDNVECMGVCDNHKCITRANSGPCKRSIECFGYCADGTCKPGGGLNESCSKAHPCALGAACVEGVCRPYPGCQAGVQGDPCFRSSQCKSPLVCGDQGVCAAN